MKFFAPIRERIAFSFREAMARSTVRLLSPVLVAMGFGFDVNNESFAKHSWFFRNALVRSQGFS